MDSKNDKVKVQIKDAVVALNSDQHLSNRKKLDQAARDARDAIEQVIDKAARATKDITKKLAPTNFDTLPG